MTQSDIHKAVKNSIAVALSNEGYIVKTGYRSKQEGEGRIDVYAEKPSGELVKVEVVNTHVPNWFLIKLNPGNQFLEIKSSSIRVTTKLLKRLAKIKARLTLKDGRERSMEELIETLADVF